MNWRANLEFLRLALIVVAGHRFWVFPLLPLAWLMAHGVFVYFNPESRLTGAELQGPLLGVPLTALGIYFGIRVIAGEIDERSLEIAYTVPGGSERLWFIKLAAGWVLLVCAEAILATLITLFYTPFPPGALYGALQAGTFFMILSLAFSTLFRGEAAGAMGTVAILALNFVITGGGDNQVRLSPFYNPYLLEQLASTRFGFDAAPPEILAWTVQNRIAMILLMSGILSLAFLRANRREVMLGSG